MADPAAGAALRTLIDERGGINGRLADLLSDAVSRDSALITPLISATQFPRGFRSPPRKRKNYSTGS